MWRLKQTRIRLYTFSALNSKISQINHKNSSALTDNFGEICSVFLIYSSRACDSRLHFLKQSHFSTKKNCNIRYKSGGSNLLANIGFRLVIQGKNKGVSGLKKLPGHLKTFQIISVFWLTKSLIEKPILNSNNKFSLCLFTIFRQLKFLSLLLSNYCPLRSQVNGNHSQQNTQKYIQLSDKNLSLMIFARS